MSIAIEEKAAGKVLEVHVSEKLKKEDYQHFMPEMERLIKKHGKIRILFDMEDFHGWEASALWEDLKLDLRHFNDIERLAMVGEAKWQKGMSWFCKPFTTAQIRYFERPDIDQARQWLEAE